MSQLEYHRTLSLSSLFVGDHIAALSQLAGRDYDHPYPRACAGMPPNIQPVHRVRAEMLLVAEGELQSQIRSVGASGALWEPLHASCAMDRTRRALRISRPSLEPRASPFNKRLRRLPVVDTLIVRVRDAAVVCACVSRVVMEMVDLQSP